MACPTLIQVAPQDAAEYKSTVIGVAEIGSNVSKWTDGSNCWLHTVLPTIVDDPLVLEFRDYFPSTSRGNFSWQPIFESGDALVEGLVERSSDPEFNRRPLLFICHGIGGLVVKRAVGLIYEQYHQPVYDRLFRTLVAIIFLGTPHPTFEEPDQWAKVSLILKAHSALRKSVIENASNHVASVANITKKFDEASHDIEIITAIEGKQTRMKSSFKRHLIVDKSLATTRSKHETIVKVDAQHADLCKLTVGSRFHAELCKLLEPVKRFTPASQIQISINAPQSAAGWSLSEVGTFGLASGLRVSNEASNLNAQASSSDRSAYDMVPGQPMKGVERVMKLPCYMMSPTPPLPEFCGRESVLLEIESALDPASPPTASSLRTFALCGAGGLGKTQIAVQYAFGSKQRKRFDAIFWVPSGDKNKLASTFATIASRLGLEDPAPDVDQAVSRDLVLEWLSHPVGSVLEGGRQAPDTREAAPRWLMIFDSADRLPILQDYWPVTGRGSILITSRDPLAIGQNYLDSPVGKMLNPFSLEVAAGLIKSLTGFCGNRDHAMAVTIAKRLSCFPLAVVQVAKTISRRSMSLEEFSQLYDQETARRAINKIDISNTPDRVNKEENKTIATTWSLEQLSPESAAVLDIISFMDPDGIQEILLTNLIMDSMRKINIPSYPASLDAFSGARSEISVSSLLQRNIADRVLTTHSIIQDTNRLNMTIDRFQTTFQATVEILCKEWPFSEFDYATQHWPKREALVAHVNALEEIYLSSALLKKPLEVSADFARLLMDVGWYHVERGRMDEAPPFFEHSESICELVPESTLITQADIFYCRADLAQMNRNPKAALPLALKFHALVSEHDPDGWRLPQSHNTLSAVYLGTGDFTEAVRHADLAITGYASLPKPEFVDWTHINKAWGQWLSGWPDKATNTLIDYLSQKESGLGPFGPLEKEPFKTGLAKSLLGCIYTSQGKYQDSLNNLQIALKELVEVVGDKNDNVAETHVYMGDTYTAMGEASSAREEYTKALEVWAERAGSFAEIARTYFKLSRACHALGDSDGEGNAHNNAQRILRKLGDNLSEDSLRNLLPAWAI